MPKFKTTIMQAEDMNATGIVVPEDVVAKLGQGKKPKVVVLLKGYSYRSTIHVMGGKSLLPLAKDSFLQVLASSTLIRTFRMEPFPG